MQLIDRYHTAPPAARRLALGWLMLAAAALGVAAVYAVVLVAARAPLGADRLPAAAFRAALAGHVVLATLVWLLAVPAAMASRVGHSRHDGWRAVCWLAACGGVALIVAGTFANGAALPVDYVPLVDHATFRTGLALFAAGAGATLMMPLAEVRDRSLDGASRAVLAAVSVPIVVAAGSLVWGLAGLPGAAPAYDYYQALFWGPGHALQFLHVVVLIVAWTVLSAAGGRRTLSPRCLALIALITALPSVAILVMQVVWGTGSASYTHGAVTLMRYGTAGLAAPLAVLLIVRGLRAPRSATSRLLTLSALLFVMGCLAGLVIRGATALVPAHYHGTVGAVTVAGMGLIAWFLEREGATAAGCVRAATWHAGGLLLLVSGLALGGTAGLPRKLAWTGPTDAIIVCAMGLVAVGGVLAVTGAARFALAAWRALAGVRRRAAMPARRSDVRLAAVAGTLAAVLIGGTLLGRMFGNEGDAGRAPIADARVDPRSHADVRRREEIARRFEQAVVMLHARRYEHAITALHRVLELAPDMPEAHVDMGYALLGAGQPAAARDFFESALVLRPAQHNGYYGLAVALEALGDIAGAVGAMRTYAHLAQRDDPYLRKAHAALWEWETRLAAARGAPQRVAAVERR